MKKIITFLWIFLCAVLISGCNKTKEQVVEDKQQLNETIVENNIETEVGPEPELEEDEIPEEPLTDYTNPNYTLASGKYYGGKRLQTNILTDNAIVYSLPDASSEVLFQAQFNQVFDVINFSDSKEEVDGVLGYWVYCYASDEQGTGEKGWVHAKDINIDRLAEVSEISFASKKRERDNSMDIYISLARHTAESNDLVEIVSANRFPGQDFFTFVWSNDYDTGFYTDPVGTFAWYPETNEIKHISFAGSIVECGWTRASDDQKYIFEDYGTGPGIRGIGVYDAAKNKEIFYGSYYDNPEYSDNEITVVTAYSDYNVSSGKISEEDVVHVKEFEETVPLTDEELELKNSGLTVGVAVQYRYNYVEDFKDYKGCIRYISQ